MYYNKLPSRAAGILCIYIYHTLQIPPVIQPSDGNSTIYFHDYPISTHQK